MKTRIEKSATVITADEGKVLYNNYLERSAGKECWLGYIYYGKDGKKLDTPYLLEPKDFSERNEEPAVEEVVDVEPEVTAAASAPKKTKKKKK